jgi:hypothetical protein
MDRVALCHPRPRRYITFLHPRPCRYSHPRSKILVACPLFAGSLCSSISSVDRCSLFTFILHPSLTERVCFPGSVFLLTGSVILPLTAGSVNLLAQLDFGMTTCAICNVEAARSGCEHTPRRCDRCCCSLGWNDADPATRVCSFHRSTVGNLLRAEFGIPDLGAVPPAVIDFAVQSQPPADSSALAALFAQLEARLMAIESRLLAPQSPRVTSVPAASVPVPSSDSADFVDSASATYSSSAAAAAKASDRFAQCQGVDTAALQNLLDNLLGSAKDKDKVSFDTSVPFAPPATHPVNAISDPFAVANDLAPRTREDIYEELASNSLALQKALRKFTKVRDLLAFLTQAATTYKSQKLVEKALAMTEYRAFLNSASLEWNAPDAAILAYHHAFVRAQYDLDPTLRPNLFSGREGFRYQPLIAEHLSKYEFDFNCRRQDEAYGKKKASGSAASTSNDKSKRSPSKGGCSFHVGAPHSDADCHVQRARKSASNSAKDSVAKPSA